MQQFKEKLEQLETERTEWLATKTTMETELAQVRSHVLFFHLKLLIFT
jgi:hypothetical protein